MQKQQEPLRVTVELPGTASPRRTDALIIKIAGEIGISSMLGPDGKHSGLDGDTTLDKALREAVPKPPKLVVVDLSAVPYLASLGMGALLRFQTRLKDSGSELRLAAATEMVTALLKRCRLDHAFKLFPDVASAL